jgi:putative tricarboxylic transport membrane protein
VTVRDRFPARPPLLLDRRSAARGLAATAVAGGLIHPVRAQIASLEILAPVGAGRGSDQLARAVAEGLRLERLVPSASVSTAPGDDADAIVDLVGGKRPSANMMVIGLETIGALFARGSKVDILQAPPLARLTGEGLALVAPAGSPIKSLAELLSALRQDPGSVRWGGRGAGSPDEQLCVSVARATGVDAKRITYVRDRDGVAVSMRVLRGEVTVAGAPLSDLIHQIRGGTLTPLALSSGARAKGVDLPTFHELGLDVELTMWRGVVARPAMNSTLFERLEGALQALTKAQGWREMLEQRFWFDDYQASDAFARFVASEQRRVADLLRDAGRPN